MNIKQFVNDYLIEHRHDILLNTYSGLIKFAEAMKKEALKGAAICDAGICKLADTAWVTPFDEDQFRQDVYDNFRAGERVRVIIVKED